MSRKELLLSLGLGLLLWAGVLIPHVTPAAARGDWRTFVPVEYILDDYLYLSQVNRAAQLGRLPGCTFVKEHAAERPLQVQIDTWVLARLAGPFLPHMKLVHAGIGLLFCLALVPLLVTLFRTCSDDAAVALLGALLVATVGLDEDINRMVCHQTLSFLPLVAGMICLRRVHLEDRPPAAWAAGIAACGAALTYSYVFHAMYFHALLGLLLLHATLTGRWPRAGILALGLAGMLGLDLPFFHQQWMMRQLPAFAEIQERLGFLASRFPSPLGTAALAAAAALLLPLLVPRERPFFGLAFLAGILCLNHHLVTGRYPPMPNAHFHTAYRLAVYLAAVPALARFAGPRTRTLAWAGIAGVLAGFFIHQVLAAGDPARLETTRRLRAYAGAVDWLERNAEAGVVVAAEEPTSSYLASHTAFYPLHSDHAYFAPVRDREILERAVFLQKLYGLEAEALPAFAQAHSMAFWGWSYFSFTTRARIMNLLARFFPGLAMDVEAFRREKLEALAEAWKSVGVREAMGRFQMDYLVYGPWERAEHPGFRPEKDPLLQPVYQDPQVSLYRIGR